MAPVIDGIRQTLTFTDFIMVFAVLTCLLVTLSLGALYWIWHHRSHRSPETRPLLAFSTATLILGGVIFVMASGYVVLIGDLGLGAKDGPPLVEERAAGIDCSSQNTSDQFTFAVVSDTQYYTDRNPEIFRQQMEWLADTECYDVVYTIHLGDMVQDSDDPEEFRSVTETLSILERNDIAYSVLAGNHDNDWGTDYTNYDRAFGYEAFADESWYGNSSDGETNRHHYDLVSAGEKEFVVLSLSYEETVSDLPIEWADSVIDRYENRTAIVTTHCSLDTDGRYGCDRAEDKGLIIHDELVEPNSNVELVLSGHNHGVAVDRTRFENRTVESVLQNYQTLRRGGNGWLRLYTFTNGSDQVDVDTYSPYLDERAVGPKNDFFVTTDRERSTDSCNLQSGDRTRSKTKKEAC